MRDPFMVLFGGSIVSTAIAPVVAIAAVKGVDGHLWIWAADGGTTFRPADVPKAHGDR